VAKGNGGIRKVSRSAETGQFVSKQEAEKNPKTTTTETVKPAPKKGT
jgi:hypothetical protein